MALGGGRPSVHELRLVLPSPAVEACMRRAGAGEALAPRLLGFDPALPHWLAATCGGCCRLRVCTSPGSRNGEVHRTEYSCTPLVLPLRLEITLDTASSEGDCTEVNALRLRPEVLLRRAVERVEIGPDGRLVEGAQQAVGGPVAPVTIYCTFTIRVVPRGPAAPLAWLALLAMEQNLQDATREAAHNLIQRHWQASTRRWGSTLAEAPPLEAATEGAGNVPAGVGGMQQAMPGSAAPLAPMAEAPGAGASVGTVGCPLTISADADTPENTPRVAPELMVQPALTKGMPFYNGFLYKLGDGLLNTTWNLRYFLLIGQSLQYYRSQHEAKPRDVVNLNGATVQWVKDQSRPFTFTVLKSGQRPLCLSGNTEKETCEWVERIQAAGKLSLEGAMPLTPSGGWRRQSCVLPGGEPAEHSEGPTAAATEATLQLCSQALLQASLQEGYRLHTVHEGLRITERVEPAPLAEPPASESTLVAVSVGILLALLLLAALRPPWPLPWLLLALAALLRLARSGGAGAGPPVVCASARIDAASEELRELLADPELFGQWRPGHLEGRLLSLVPVRDEIIYTRFRLGLPGLVARLRARRRWVRGSDGVRLLCSAAESEGEGGGVGGFEGFAVLPGDESGCTVLWLCGLALAPWAPRWLQEFLAVRRVGALTGLREWLACPTCPVERQCLGAAKARGLGDMLHHTVGSQSGTLLRGFRRAAAGGLHLPHDLERAALSAQLLIGLAHQLLLGGHSLAVATAPHGLLPQAGADLVQRYAARWAYAPMFLQAAGNIETPRERLVLVVAFVVAGLHLAAVSYPHLPWVSWPAGGVRQSAVLPGDTRVSVEVAGASRRASFEVFCPGSSGFRIFGTDSVGCLLEPPAALSFTDCGETAIEFAPGGSVVRLSLPRLRVGPSGWSLGLGSNYQWTGCAHFVDEAGGVQCNLGFGPASGAEGADAVSGTMRDALGFEIGRVRGSWLGPLFCDGEVLWRGPRQQPAPY